MTDLNKNEPKVHKLNSRLMVQQKVTEEQEANLQRLYNELEQLFIDADAETDMLRMPIYAMRLEALEFELQENWNFEKTSTMHRYWFRLPHCQCPRYDNEDRIGTEYRIFSLHCPAHGVNAQSNPKGLH